ncbi:MAG: hypothetical protein WCG21_00255 [Eubacteriales bacterium]
MFTNISEVSQLQWGEDIMSSIDLNYSIDTEESKADNQKEMEKRDDRREQLTRILMVLSLFIMLFIMIVAVIAN